MSDPLQHKESRKWLCCMEQHRPTLDLRAAGVGFRAGSSERFRVFVASAVGFRVLGFRV